MSTENAIETTERKAKRASVSLTAGEGDKTVRLTIIARRTGGNRGETVVMTTDAKKKTARGMTTKYESFELATAALTKLTADAVKAGWKRNQRAGGFKARPDAFNAIPTAPKR